MELQQKFDFDATAGASGDAGYSSMTMEEIEMKLHVCAWRTASGSSIAPVLTIAQLRR